MAILETKDLKERYMAVEKTKCVHWMGYPFP